jgi:hypothetical protein
MVRFSTGAPPLRTPYSEIAGHNGRGRINPGGYEAPNSKPTQDRGAPMGMHSTIWYGHIKNGVMHLTSWLG